MGKKTKKNVKKGNAESKLKSEVDESTVVLATSAGVGETVNKNETKDGAAVNIETRSTTGNTVAKPVRNSTGAIKDSKSDITRAEIQPVRNMCPARPASDMITRSETQPVRNMCPARPASDMTTRAEIQPVRNMCPVFDMITRAETQSVRNSSPTSVGIEPNIKLEMFPMTEVGANQTIVNVFSSTKENKNGVQNEAIIQKRSVSIADTRARGKKRPEDNKNDKLPGIKNQDNDSHTEYKKEVDAQAKAEMSPASTGKVTLTREVDAETERNIEQVWNLNANENKIRYNENKPRMGGKAEYTFHNENLKQEVVQKGSEVGVDPVSTGQYWDHGHGPKVIYGRSHNPNRYQSLQDGMLKNQYNINTRRYNAPARSKFNPDGETERRRYDNFPPSHCRGGKRGVFHTSRGGHWQGPYKQSGGYPGRSGIQSTPNDFRPREFFQDTTPRFPNPGFQVFKDPSVHAHPTPYHPNPDPYTRVEAGAQGSHTQLIYSNDYQIDSLNKITPGQDHSWSDRDRSLNGIQLQEMIKGQDMMRMNVNVPEFVPRFQVPVPHFLLPQDQADYMFDTSKIDVFNPPDLFNQTVLPTFLGSPTFFTEVQCSNTFIEDKVEFGSVDLACNVQQGGDHDTEVYGGKDIEMQTETKIEGMNITEVQSCNTEVQSRNTGVNPRKKIKKGQKEKKTDVPEDKMENDVPDGKSGKDFVLEPNRTTVPTVHQEIPKEITTMKHPLHRNWTLWYCKQEAGKEWNDCQMKVMDFNTVEDFWALYNHTQSVSETYNADYSIFRKGIFPCWDDKMNKNGGRWVYSYRHDDRNGSETLEMLWKFLVLGLIGENGPASVHNQMNGVVVSVRDWNKPSKLGVWVNSDGTYNNHQILSYVLKALALDSNKKWVFSRFNESYTTDSSKKKRFQN